jgi:parallel beta-helix repeat protein
MKRTRNVPLEAALAVTLLLGGVAHAKGTPIDHCPFVITAPGNYFVAKDLGPCASPAITIAVSDNHQLKGNTTNGNGFDRVSGLCRGSGIEVTQSSGNELTENTANNNCAGGIAVGLSSTANRIKENTAFNNRVVDLSGDNPNCDANLWVENKLCDPEPGLHPLTGR